MQAYSKDLRQRIVRGRQQGIRAQELADRYQVSRRAVEKYWQRYQQTGELTSRKRGGYLRSRLVGHEKTLLGWIEQEPDLTLVELQCRCAQKLNIHLTVSALWYRLKALGLSFKKNDARHRAKAARRASRAQKLA